jgi:ornithine cyclodeaminase
VVRETLSTGGIFGIKSGHADSTLGFKAAGFWPENRLLGGAAHQATIVLFDPLTGRPRCVMDGNTITTARTGAAGAIGISLFARADAQRLCVFGSGVQARVQTKMAIALLPALKQVVYLTATGAKDPSFEEELGRLCPLVHATHADEAVSKSEVVITATPGRGPLFSVDAVRPGTHLNCVGTDTKGKRELPDGLLDRARVIVDDATQAAQIGETQWSPNVDVTEIGALLGGNAEQLKQATYEISVFDMTGLALQDLVVAEDLYSKAIQRRAGLAIPWSW